MIVSSGISKLIQNNLEDLIFEQDFRFLQSRLIDIAVADPEKKVGAFTLYRLIQKPSNAL